LIRGRIRSLALSRHGIGVLAQTRNGLLVVDPKDFGVATALLGTGAYDWEQVSWLSRLVGSQSRMVFVGAHVGALLVPLAQLSGSRDLEAFEPSPANHRFLKANLALNGLSDAVVVHHLAVGDSAGCVRFTENPINTGNSRVASTGEVEVQMTTLDAALPGTAPIQLLVIDTEGFEVHALRGAARVLAQTRYLYIEYAPEQLVEQGSTPQELLQEVAGQFESMYLPGEEARFFPARSYLDYLGALPMRRGQLLNLLFSRDTQPQPKLLQPN
jgi:FkbM family methyltransferase